MSCVPICRCCSPIARGSFLFFFGYKCLIDGLVCSSRKSLAEEESRHPESSDSCTGLHAERLWVGKERGMQVKWKGLSPHLLPGGGQWHFYISWLCSHLLPVFNLAERAGVYRCPPFFLPTDLPVTVKPPQHRDFRPGSGGHSAFHTAAATSPAGSLPK